MIATAPIGSPQRWIKDSLDFAAIFVTSSIPGYTFASTLNAWGDFLNRVVPPFRIADGAGALNIISVYKIMGAAVAGTATVLGDMLNGVYDMEQIAIDVIYTTTGATVTRSDLHNATTLGLKVGASVALGGGVYSSPEEAFNIVLPTLTAAQVNPFTLVTYVALVALYKRFQEIALFQTYTTNTTYESWHYKNALGMYAAGTFHVVDQDGNPVQFFGVSQGGTYTSDGHALVTVNNSTGGFTYTPPAVWDSKFQDDAFFHRSTSENEADRYDTVQIPVLSADGAPYTLTFKIGIIGGTNANPTGTVTVIGTDGLGVVKGKVNGGDADGDTLKYSLVGSSVNGLSNNSAYTKNGAGNGGIVTINPDTGDFTYISSATVSGSQSFQVNINDGHYGNTVVTVTVTNSTAAITPTNINTSTQYYYSGKVPGSSTYLPGGFSSFSLGAPPTKGSVTSFDPTTGAFTYHRDESLGHGPTTDDYVNILATDANGRTVSLRLLVQPTIPNAAPTVTVTGTAGVGSRSGTTQTVTMPAGTIKWNDTDGDALKINGITVPVGSGTVTLSTRNGGTVVLKGDGSFTYTRNVSDAQSHQAAKIVASDSDRNDYLDLTVTDGYSGTAMVAVRLPVYASNNRPVTSGTYGAVFTKNVTVVKVTDSDGDGLTYIWSQNGTFTGGYDGTGTKWGVNNPVSLTVYDGYYKVVNGVVDTTRAGAVRTWTNGTSLGGGSGSETDATPP